MIVKNLIYENLRQIKHHSIFLQYFAIFKFFINFKIDSNTINFS